MLHDLTEQKLDTGATTQAPSESAFLARKIWLPKLLYDCLPYFYLTAGFAAVFATLYISEWFWLMPHYCLFAVACIHLGVTIYRKRRRNGSSDCRDTPAES